MPVGEVGGNWTAEECGEGTGLPCRDADHITATRGSHDVPRESRGPCDRGSHPRIREDARDGGPDDPAGYRACADEMPADRGAAPS